MKWYQLTVKEVSTCLLSEKNGLSTNERETRLKRDGKNIMTEKNKPKKWQKLLKHFTDLLMIVLLFAAGLKLFIGEYLEGSIILLVVIINGLVGYWQEKKAEESLNGLKEMMGQDATVLVDGIKKRVCSEELVKGDVVELKAGDKVPADIRLIECHDLLIEESILTGESEASEKRDVVVTGKVAPGDQINMAFSGTLVQSGSAIGMVVGTGDKTEIGKINEALQDVKEQTTPLVKKIHQLNKTIFKGIAMLVVFLVFYSTFRFNMGWEMLFSAVIALVVSMIPEGLPAVLTMILSLGVKEMAEENAIIKSMPSVETLGSMTVICSDKTGTLTKNQMSVMSTKTDDSKRLLEIMNNCQDLKTSDLQPVSELKGNPTELALLAHVEKSKDELSLKEVLGKIPFSSSYKYMATLHSNGDKRIIFVKGAPEVLLGKSNLTTDGLKKWQDYGSEFAQKGQRVLGFACKEVSTSTDLSHKELTDLTFVGIAGLIDPPKTSAIKAIEECYNAGISVKMITGDHKETARAIGREIGLKHTEKVLEGTEIDELNATELAQIVNKVDVYARTTPEHKLRIVEALQQNGEIVGMTGDGVNDAPALKKADIGIAMGIKGSEVSKQASDMVLADDNFFTIAKAVKEGRRIYDNLKKTINFFLPTALAQGLVVILALVTDHPLPLTPVQILWVNMVTTITLSYALGFEKASDDLMKRPPRATNEKIISYYEAFRISYVSLMIMSSAYLLAMTFDDIATQQTVLLQSIVLAQGVYMINCRELTAPSLSKGLLNNKSIFISLFLLMILQLGVIYLPVSQELLGTTSLDVRQQGLILINSLILFVVVEVEKRITHTVLNKKSRKLSQTIS
ncbi:HAD-IC family P-type ATPase [Vagococcus fluvialis]|uniref:HAD-IC family P-type ATPase n=1 Tax=Vagococcus fluvialis TaxID=2738 RepID=UPI003D0FBB25